MTLLASWPTLTDDGGDGTSGTVLDKAVFDAIKASVEDNVHSANNTTVQAKDIIDEVVDARGNVADLDTRLSGVIDSDGALITPASIVSSSQLTAQQGAGMNLAKNSTFFIWPSGLTAAPAYYTLANGTVTIAGTDESDTTRKIGKKCAKITWSSGAATLTQIILNSADFANLDHLKGETKKIAFGAWVKTSIASHARLQLNDGVTTTETSYHTGGGTWEFLGGVHTMSGASTELELLLRVESSGSAYFSGVTAAFGDFAPTLWIPERIVRGHALLEIAGDLSTGDGKKYLTFGRPIRIDALQALVLTDPTGASINVDFEKFEPTTTWTSMITAGALIDDGDGVGQLLTTGDYDHRCLNGWFGASGELAATGQENRMCRFNIDQVGSSATGANMFLRVDGVQCMHPFEDQLSYNFLGV